MKLVWEKWYLYIPSILATVAYLVLDMVMRTMTGQAMDAATKVGPLFWNRFGWLVATPLLAAPFHTISMLTKFGMGNQIQTQLRIAVGEKATVLSIPALEEKRSGDIMAHLGTEIQSVTGFVGYGLSMITTLVTVLVGTMAFMAAVDWQLTLLFLAVSLLVLPVSLYVSRPMKRMEETLRDVNGKAQQIANEGLGARLTVKSFRLEALMDRRFWSALGEMLAVDLQMQRSLVSMTAIGKLLGYLPMMAMLFLGALRVSQNTLSPGMLLSLTTVSSGFVGWLTQVPGVFGYIQRSRGACERLYAYMDLPEESGGTQATPKEEAPFVEFRDVTFAYPETGALFEKLSFTLRRGEKVALVGASGSGKSTVLRLICGFLQAKEGSVWVRGHQVGEWELMALRRQIAYVTQDSYLFPGSLRDNLLAAKKDADEQQLRNVCLQAGILDFVEERGWDAQAGEGGMQLSGGQRQRIAIARAMLKGAPLLLLDEPTSALDAAAEQVVQESLDRLMEQKTTLVVAHRLATIRNADRILVLEDGKIVAQGTHETLMEESRTYREMVKKQLLGGQEI